MQIDQRHQGASSLGRIQGKYLPTSLMKRENWDEGNLDSKHKDYNSKEYSKDYSKEYTNSKDYAVDLSKYSLLMGNDYYINQIVNKRNPLLNKPHQYNLKRIVNIYGNNKQIITPMGGPQRRG